MIYFILKSAMGSDKKKELNIMTILISFKNNF